MPTYQYVCTDCGERLELQQSFSDEALTVCPTCDGRLRKVFGAVGVVFKGSGFYRTDSRAAASNGTSDGEAKPAAKDASPVKDSGSKPTESKPGKAAKSPTGSPSGKGSAA